MKRVRHSYVLVVCVLMISSATAQEKPASAQASEGKRGRTFVDALEQPVVGDPQLSPDGKQILFTIDKADWKANRANRSHLPHQRRRHQPGAAHVRRSRRGQPALVAGREADRVHDASRSRHQQPDLPPQRRGRRSAAPHQSPDGAGQHRRGRPTASRSTSSPRTRSRPKRGNAIASRTTCMRSRRTTSSSATCGRRISTARRRRSPTASCRSAATS